jgi:hypothetical protein
MKILQAKVGDTVDFDYPPRCIVSDIWNGVVTLMMIDNPEETLQDLRAAANMVRAKKHRDMRKLANRRKTG